MYQYDDPTAASALPALPAAAVAGFYTDGNPAAGQPASDVRAGHLNVMMLEIMNAITGAGIALDRTNNAQLLAAIRALTAPPDLSVYLLKSAFASRSMTASGYQVIPSPNGTPSLILQWGVTPVVLANSEYAVTFPIAFPNAAFSANATLDYSLSSTLADDEFAVCRNLTTTGITVARNIGTGNTHDGLIYWSAYGN